jgi:dihydrodipicolinate synthase/N-acetylneuraminate lyase
MDDNGGIRTASLTRREMLWTLGSSVFAGSIGAKASSEKPMLGVFPIMSTPYNDKNEVDWEDLARQVDFLTRCGVHGMAWPQLLGETFQLTPEERRQGMKVIASAGKGKAPAIVLGVDGPDLKSALAYLEYAEKLEPDALIALPPWGARTLQEVLDYYRALGRATQRPIFIQNADIGNGVKPGIDEIVAVAREFPHCGYFKEEISPTLPRLAALQKQKPPVRRVFGGEAGKNFMYLLRLGLDGVMAGNAYADVFVQVWDAYQAGNKELALEIYSKLCLMSACEGYVPWTREYVLKKRGVFKTIRSRRRKYEFSPEQIAEVEFFFGSLKPYLKA